MIQIKNLQKKFSSDLWDIEIFKNFNLEISSWEFIALIWPSWSGKSTFLNLLSWLDRDYDWELKIDWKNLSDFSDEEITDFRWQNISYIFQNFKLIDNLTVEENIDLILDLNNLERNFETKEILSIVWLESKSKTLSSLLSWWESQRVAIARAFVGKTILMLADEPTWSLDIKNKKIIMDLIIDLHKKTKNTIVMITHDDEVAKIADKVYKMQDYTLIKN